MSKDLTNTYWSQAGKYQSLAAQLQNLGTFQLDGGNLVFHAFTGV